MDDEHIIDVLRSDDPRPVWIIVWGGPMDFAQALWKLRETLGAESEALAAIITKVRYYQISWQDTGAVWLWNEFPELFRIQSDYAMRGMFTEGDVADRDQTWIDQHVRNGHGVLGAEYPVAGQTDGIKEGDTPSFLHLLKKGLSDPDKPSFGGWGGRFKAYGQGTNYYVDDIDDHQESSDTHGLNARFVAPSELEESVETVHIILK